MEFETATSRFMRDRARALRKRATPEERVLWEALRGHALGVMFRRQHPLGRYIVDFYCVELHSAVELDGAGHEFEKDLVRSVDLYDLGVALIVRFENSRVREQLTNVLAELRAAILRARIEAPFAPEDRRRSRH